MTDLNDYRARSERHIDISKTVERADYLFPNKDMKGKPRRADYRAHADLLRSQLAFALGPIPDGQADTREAIGGLKKGAIVQFETAALLPGARAAAAKLPGGLEFPGQDIVVLKSLRTDNRNEQALVFVPDAARAFLDDKLDRYGRPVLTGDARPDAARFEVVEVIRGAAVDALFEGIADPPKGKIWWEIWTRKQYAAELAAAAQRRDVPIHADRLHFPDTTVLFAHGDYTTVRDFVARCAGVVGEVRPSKSEPGVFLERTEGGVGPTDWVNEFAERILPPNEDAPKVCVLDTGVSAAHPLFAKALAVPMTYDAAWLTDDHHPHGGHGTGMVGLSLYGDLEPHLAGKAPFQLTHTAISMKFLPPKGFPPTKPPSYGFVTQGAIALVEVEHRRRPTYLIATSTEDFPAGRPSSWSGALDQVCAGSMPGDPNGDDLPATEKPKRLMLVAAGNVLEGPRLDVLKPKDIEDPAQSWNALTIGGYTTKEKIPPVAPPLKPLVAANERSPFSAMSFNLPPDLTPIKPELLFEAGNMAVDGSDNCEWHPSVSLVAAGKDVRNEPLTSFWATSAATGCAGQFFGALESGLPGLWPETYRALAVQSADWPAPIRKQLVGKGAHWKSGSKAQKLQIVRTVGYGVPDLERAMLSAKNDMTLVAQAELQPYIMGDYGTAVFNDMHFYDLPWPTSALEKISNEIVVMKVVLSYFIEPNLNGRAATRPDTYRSFGLRFAMKKGSESTKRFRRRINRAEEAPASREQERDADYWLLGSNSQQAGSLHCDLWRGRAIDLALHDAIAIYPVGGWWKSHLGQRRSADKARYSLAISICAPNSPADLYTEAAALVDAKLAEIAVAVEIDT